MLQSFPIPILKILPMALTAAGLTGCHSATAVEASTTRNPVVAPAGTVLRVRLNQTLETGRSRPGDRFSGVLDTAVISGRQEVLPKGTLVEGRVVNAAGGSSRGAAESVLAVTIDSFEMNGRRFPVSANVVTRRMSEGAPRESFRLSVAANSIVGFTLTEVLTVAL
jgi:hypothetical protein